MVLVNVNSNVPTCKSYLLTNVNLPLSLFKKLFGKQVRLHVQLSALLDSLLCSVLVREKWFSIKFSFSNLTANFISGSLTQDGVQNDSTSGDQRNLPPTSNKPMYQWLTT